MRLCIDKFIHLSSSLSMCLIDTEWGEFTLEYCFLPRHTYICANGSNYMCTKKSKLGTQFACIYT